MKTALVIRHVAFEDLGVLEPLLAERGYRIHCYEAGRDELWTIDPGAPDLLVVLGGPMGATDFDTHPFLREEIALLRHRREARLPSLGICLGAQLMAVAAGGGIRTMPAREIGIGEVVLSAQGRASCLRPLAETGQVLHWHGDEIRLPDGIATLASTAACAAQAFELDGPSLGLQFHLEADLERIGEWTRGHAGELREARLSASLIEQQARSHAAALQATARRVFGQWLDGLNSPRRAAAARSSA